jgi:hypothetical protein
MRAATKFQRRSTARRRHSPRYFVLVLGVKLAAALR